MGKRLSGLILAACITALSNGAAFADEFHYTNLLIGDRAPGMGGAYTAVSDDATGLYYNPAGVAYTTGRSLSASVNAYYYTTKTYKDVFGGGNAWERTSSSLLPNYFGVVQPLGGWKIGFSYAVPESIMSDQQQTFHDVQLGSSLQPINPGVTISTEIINFNEERNTYNFGPSIAKELTDKLSAGLTLYIYERKSLRILNQIIKLSNGGSELTNAYQHEEEYGLRPVLGGMWSPVETVSIGVAVSKIFLTHSNINFQHSLQSHGFFRFDTNGQVVSESNELPDGQSATSARRNYPTQVSAGVAWFPSHSLLISGDINYFTEVDEQIISMEGQLVQLRPHTNALTNISLGTEYYLSKNLAVRAGFYTDYANTPKIASGGTDQSEHIDIYGITASVSHYTRNTSVTLGGGKTNGKGQAQIVGGVTNVQTAVVDGWMLFLSSSYSY